MAAKEEEKENKERKSGDKQWPDYIALVSMVTKGCHIPALIKGLMNYSIETEKLSKQS